MPSSKRLIVEREVAGGRVTMFEEDVPAVDVRLEEGDDHVHVVLGATPESAPAEKIEDVQLRTAKVRAARAEGTRVEKPAPKKAPARKKTTAKKATANAPSKKKG